MEGICSAQVQHKTSTAEDERLKGWAFILPGQIRICTLVGRHERRRRVHEGLRLRHRFSSARTTFAIATSTVNPTNLGWTDGCGLDSGYLPLTSKPSLFRFKAVFNARVKHP